MDQTAESKPRVLVVDDSRLMRVAAKKILKEHFEIEEAADGEIACRANLFEEEVLAVSAALSGGEVVRDAVALNDGDAGDVFFFNLPVIGPDGPFFPAGAGRINDGVDTDADGICDAGDSDSDGDGYSNDDETTNCVPPSDPLDAGSTPVDTDGDLSCDTLDDDDDNDSILDGDDVDPVDPARCQDLDGDTCDDCSLAQPPNIGNDGLDKIGRASCRERV